MKGARFWGMEFDRNDPPADDPNKRHFDEAVLVAESRQSSLRSMAKQALAAPSALALWQASKAKPQLSADSLLASRKQQLLDVIGTVRRDYF